MKPVPTSYVVRRFVEAYKAMGLTTSDANLLLDTGKRDRWRVERREEAIWRMRQQDDQGMYPSWPEIAELFDSVHSTMQLAYKRHAARCSVEEGAAC